MIKYIQSHYPVPEGKNRGLALLVNEGNLVVVETDYPTDNYIVYQAWAEDMLKKLYEHSKLRRWLIRLLLGRYAFRELMGMRDQLEKDGLGDLLYTGYGLEDCEYNKREVNW